MKITLFVINLVALGTIAYLISCIMRNNKKLLNYIDYVDSKLDSAQSKIISLENKVNANKAAKQAKLKTFKSDGTNIPNKNKNRSNAKIDTNTTM